MIWYKCKSRKRYLRLNKFHPSSVRIQCSLNSAKSAKPNKRITYFLSLIWSSTMSKKAPTRGPSMARQIYSINSGLISISWTPLRLPNFNPNLKTISISSISTRTSHSHLLWPKRPTLLRLQLNGSKVSNLTLKGPWCLNSSLTPITLMLTSRCHRGWWCRLCLEFNSRRHSPLTKTGSFTCSTLFKKCIIPSKTMVVYTWTQS